MRFALSPILAQAALEQNKRRQEAFLAEVKPFHLRVLERPSNLDQVKAELEERRRQVRRSPRSEPPTHKHKLVCSRAARGAGGAARGLGGG